MRKIITNYTFNKVAQTITFTDYTTIDLKNIFVIIDVTNNTLIYQANKVGYGGSVAGNVLTLDFNTNTGSYNNSDDLQIAYEEATTPVELVTLPSDYSPAYGAWDEGATVVYSDPDGQLKVRGPVLTDEGSYTINFSGSALGVSIGTCAFVNGSAVVTGTGFSGGVFYKGDYVKLDADGESTLAQVYSIDSDTQLTLYTNYTGSSSSGASSVFTSKSITGSGGSIAVASGQATIASGTTTNAQTLLTRNIDYLPITVTGRFSISQRIANQRSWFGTFYDSNPATAKWYAAFLFDGTDNKVVKCETGFNKTTAPSASEKETTTVTFPTGTGTTGTISSNTNDYAIEIKQREILFYVNDILVARHKKVIIRPADALTLIAGIENQTSPGSTTSMVLDNLTTSNYNRVDVNVASQNDGIISKNVPDTILGPTNVTANNTDFFVVDMLNHRSMTLQLSSVGGGATVSFQGSNLPDFSGTLISLLAYPSGGGAPVTSSTAVGHWIIPRTTRYIRIRTTAYTSGTITCNALIAQQPAMPPEIRTTYNGTQAVSQSGTWTVQPGNTANTTAWLMNNIPNSAQGASTSHHLISAASTNATSVKASAGVINTIQVSNINAAFRYFKLYNKASAPTVGTDTPVLTLALPPNSSVPVDCGPFGIRLATGIAYALTTGMAVADTGAVAATEHSVFIQYT
jgi:hypothetical protein